MGSRLLDYHYMRFGRRCSGWLRVYQLHQVLLLMLLLLLLLWEASKVVKHVSRSLLLVVCRKQLDGEALVLAWNSSCWNGNGALLLLLLLLLCLVRLVRNVHAKLFDDAREGEGGVRGGGGDPGQLVRVHSEGRQLNLRVGDGQHIRQEGVVRQLGKSRHGRQCTRSSRRGGRGCSLNLVSHWESGAAVNSTATSGSRAGSGIVGPAATGGRGG